MTPNLRACDCCGERHLPEALEDVSDKCGRERWACAVCVEEIEAEWREEALRESWDAEHREYEWYR